MIIYNSISFALFISASILLISQAYPKIGLAVALAAGAFIVTRQYQHRNLLLSRDTPERTAAMKKILDSKPTIPLRTIAAVGLLSYLYTYPNPEILMLVVSALYVLGISIQTEPSSHACSSMSIGTASNHGQTSRMMFRILSLAATCLVIAITSYNLNGNSITYFAMDPAGLIACVFTIANVVLGMSMCTDHQIRNLFYIIVKTRPLSELSTMPVRSLSKPNFDEAGVFVDKLFDRAAQSDDPQVLIRRIIAIQKFSEMEPVTTCRYPISLMRRLPGFVEIPPNEEFEGFRGYFHWDPCNPVLMTLIKDKREAAQIFEKPKIPYVSVHTWGENECLVEIAACNPFATPKSLAPHTSVQGIYVRAYREFLQTDHQSHLLGKDAVDFLHTTLARHVTQIQNDSIEASKRIRARKSALRAQRFNLK